MGSFRTRIAPETSLCGLCSARHNTILWKNHHNREITHKLPKVTLALPLVVLLNAPSTADSPTAAQPARPLVDQAAENLAQQPSVEAKLRQRVDLLGNFFVGSGNYRQLTIGNRQMFRLEIKLQVAERLTSLLEVSDGTTLWIRRDLGDEKSLAYVHLGRLRERAGRTANTIGGPPAQHLAVGGLHQLLRGLNASFDFGPPLASHIGEQPVWQLTGYWKPAQLAQLLPAQQAEILAGEPVDLAQLPLHLPHVVKLALGSDDQLPLFPYRIEYGRFSGATVLSLSAAPEAAVSYRAVATMELFEVRRYVNMNPRDFTFQPRDEQVEDQTELFLRKLGIEPVSP